ncbi:MAG TPA: MoaD/ThiS family protein [Gemmatimonadaceae bacterium]|nr:MoaD/ThiS family protein [Gemmatimonadaceae bacterium]
MSVVIVQLFASYAELVGRTTITVPLTDGDRVSDLLRNLRSVPLASALPESPRVAVNHAFAAGSTRLHPGDEIALIPPVAGG